MMGQYKVISKYVVECNRGLTEKKDEKFRKTVDPDEIRDSSSEYKARILQLTLIR
jgi:hypothetical protein